jgi:pyruvate dehydrogenase E2 component (dihydrolipoamide acetyltransferase)
LYYTSLRFPRYEQVDINLLMGAGSYIATPVLRDVAARGLGSIASEIAQVEDILFADDGAGGDLRADAEKMALGTFSIQNLGIYGVKAAAPIALTPQACALSLGAIVDAVVPSDGKGVEVLCVVPMMTATLSCDHRVVDGAVGAQWLSAFKQMVENPGTMLL